MHLTWFDVLFRQLVTKKESAWKGRTIKGKSPVNQL